MRPVKVSDIIRNGWVFAFVHLSDSLFSISQYSRAVKPIISDQLCILWIKHEIWHDKYLNPGGHNQARNHLGSDLWWPWVTFKVKVIVYMSKNMIFREIKERTSVIPLFDVILIQESTPNYFLWLFLILQGHL